AESAYRQALDIFLEFDDRRAASGTATRLGALLAELGRHSEATRTLLYAAVSWHQEASEWNQGDLDLLRQERQALQPAEFTALIAAEVPPELAEELTAALDRSPEDR
ncbi:MAG TPA: hypothetical protein VFI65_13185, partial [Streptosporangiaceae bacterium]|nr:hypothetical protein [Streptosporangiaceae bacterium]